MYNEKKLDNFELSVQAFAINERTPREPREPKSAPAKAVRAPRERTRERAPREPRETREPREPKEKFVPKKTGPPKKLSASSIYIGNLSFKVDEKMFDDFIYGFGKIDERYIKMDSRGRSKGFGVVTFKYAEDA